MQQGAAGEGGGAIAHTANTLRMTAMPDAIAPMIGGIFILFSPLLPFARKHH